MLPRFVFIACAARVYVQHASDIGKKRSTRLTGRTTVCEPIDLDESKRVQRAPRWTFARLAGLSRSLSR